MLTICFYEKTTVKVEAKHIYFLYRIYKMRCFYPSIRHKKDKLLLDSLTCKQHIFLFLRQSIMNKIDELFETDSGWEKVLSIIVKTTMLGKSDWLYIGIFNAENEEFKTIHIIMIIFMVWNNNNGYLNFIWQTRPTMKSEETPCVHVLETLWN